MTEEKDLSMADVLIKAVNQPIILLPIDVLNLLS